MRAVSRRIWRAKNSLLMFFPTRASRQVSSRQNSLHARPLSVGRPRGLTHNPFLSSVSNQAELMNKPTPRFALLALAAFAAFPALSSHAQSGSFIISQRGHSVGTATVSFNAVPDGYDSTSIIRVAMQGLNYSVSKTEKLTSANSLKHVQLSATVNGSAVNLNAAPDAAQILLNISANGRSTTTRLAAHPCRCSAARL